MKIKIEIDCDPFSPRPDVYFQHIWTEILKNTESIPEASSKFFGCWSWNDIEVSKEQKEQIGDYLKKLYNQGNIRYASW